MDEIQEQNGQQSLDDKKGIVIQKKEGQWEFKFIGHINMRDMNKIFRLLPRRFAQLRRKRSLETMKNRRAEHQEKEMNNAQRT